MRTQRPHYSPQIPPSLFHTHTHTRTYSHLIVIPHDVLTYHRAAHIHNYSPRFTCNEAFFNVSVPIHKNYTTVPPLLPPSASSLYKLKPAGQLSSQPFPILSHVSNILALFILRSLFMLSLLISNLQLFHFNIFNIF